MKHFHLLRQLIDGKRNMSHCATRVLHSTLALKLQKNQCVISLLPVRYKDHSSRNTEQNRSSSVCALLAKPQRHISSDQVFSQPHRGRFQATLTTLSEGSLLCNNRSINCFHTSASSSSQADVEAAGSFDFLPLTIGSRTLRIPYVWLRDHCRSESCYNHTTNQKNVDVHLLTRDLSPTSVTVSEDGGDGSVSINWKDGHTSRFSFQWLLDNFYSGDSGKGTQPRSWTKSCMSPADRPVVTYEEHMNTESGLKQSLTNLICHGFTLVDGAPATREGTQAVAERICCIQHTLFGGVTVFSSDGSRSDTAYSAQALGAHTDNTYLSSRAGIQMFQCLGHTGSGGETLLVDGLRAMEQLRASDPGAFQLLSQVAVPHEYKEAPSENSPGYHMYSLETVISAHPVTGDPISLRFNPYDRAPLNTVVPTSIPAYYQAYDKLASIIASEENELWIKLKPGTVLLIDNWRVMHGRAAFDGKRIMCSGYLPRDEWRSRARMFHVL